MPPESRRQTDATTGDYRNPVESVKSGLRPGSVSSQKTLENRGRGGGNAASQTAWRARGQGFEPPILHFRDVFDSMPRDSSWGFFRCVGLVLSCKAGRSDAGEAGGRHFDRFAATEPPRPDPPRRRRRAAQKEIRRLRRLRRRAASRFGRRGRTRDGLRRPLPDRKPPGVERPSRRGAGRRTGPRRTARSAGRPLNSSSNSTTTPSPHRRTAMTAASANRSTFEPAVVSNRENAVAVGPWPSTAIDRGAVRSSATSSGSSTVRPSNGTPRGRRAVVPTAMTSRSAVTCSATPPARLSAECGPVSRTPPRKTATPSRRRRSISASRRATARSTSSAGDAGKAKRRPSP